MTNNKRVIRPRMNYKHILSELSVNRKDPCEVIRELISNSYDASASRIEIYPLLQYSGFIFFDNGTGISEKKVINDITPFDAFFSIGNSTKILGKYIGYKCQGSKLCFAANKFALITRCGEEKEPFWRTVSIDNPKEKLDPNNPDIEIQDDTQPWETLKNLFQQPDIRTEPILNHLNDQYFKKYFISGTMIIVKDIEVENFSSYYGTDEKYSYIKSYIRLNTRHGDVRVLNPEKTGFNHTDAKNFQTSSQTYNDQCKLFIWTGNKSPLEEIPVGYPYIDKSDLIPQLEKFILKSPVEISRLRDGRFYSRHAHTFRFEGTVYCIALAIDGNRRALNFYDDLDRQGKKKSGIVISSQRGTFICSEGVKICPYNEIFDQSKMIDYSVLSDSKAQSHYVLMINGSFQLVTNRNYLSEPSIKILQNPAFLEHIKFFLDRVWAKDVDVFRPLIERLKNQIGDSKIEIQVKQFEQSKSEIKNRNYFIILDIEHLINKQFIEPANGEEHWVGALYTLFAHLVPENSPFAYIWMRPLNFSGIGIDSIAVDYGKTDLTRDLKGIEYKYSFSSDEIFNHPLISTEQIVCWELEPIKGEQTETVTDGEWVGEILLTEELKDIGYEITNIESRYSGHHNRNIKVISLKNLLNKTFKCEWKNNVKNIMASKSKKNKKSNT